MLFSLLLIGLAGKKIKSLRLRMGSTIVLFLFLYILATLLIVPPVAAWLGRVPLPLSGSLRPLTMMTCILNRHYVHPDLKHIAEETATAMDKKYPGSHINYLDANFPFFNKFPLLPHLSHNDGKKLDLAFYYIEKKSGRECNESPSIIGYGVCEHPKHGEENIPGFCKENGYWQYGFLEKIIPQGKKADFEFDERRTSFLIISIAGKALVEKIFIEPHLKSRMNLSNSKIRFHGCQAVRHDDHIHFQIK